MEKKVYDDKESVIKSLNRNGIIVVDKFIQIRRGLSVGIKLWGMIDYLCKYCGYEYVKEV